MERMNFFWFARITLCAGLMFIHQHQCSADKPSNSADHNEDLSLPTRNTEQLGQFATLLGQLTTQVTASIATSGQTHSEEALTLLTWLSENQARLPSAIVEWFIAHQDTMTQSTLTILTGLAPHFAPFIMEGGTFGSWAIKLLLERLDEHLEKHSARTEPYEETSTIAQH